MSSASERANGRASGPVLSTGFLIILGHSTLTRMSYVCVNEKKLTFAAANPHTLIIDTPLLPNLFRPILLYSNARFNTYLISLMF